MGSSRPTFRQRVLSEYVEQRKKGFTAKDALAVAKEEARYGRGSCKRWVMPRDAYTQRTTLPNGWYYDIEVAYDNDAAAPWERCDGHGVVTGWQSRDEYKDEWVLNSERYSYRYYDFKASLALSLKDGWDAPPYAQGSKLEQAVRAVRADYEYLRRWCNDDWWYVGIIVTLYDEQDVEIDSESCWGYDSDSTTFLTSEARDWVAGMIKQHRRNLRQSRLEKQIDGRFNDATECGL